MPKDRYREQNLAPDVRMVIKRSSAHPVEYAIVLLVLRGGNWYTVLTCDNAHACEEHHEHRYVGTEKQPPAVTRGPVNDAMRDAMIRMQESWPDIVGSWEK